MADNYGSTHKGNRVLLCLLEMFIQVILFLSVAAVIYFAALQKPDSHLFYCLIIVIPVMLAYLLRRVIRSFSLFVASHIILAGLTAVMLGVSDSTQRVFSVVLALAVVLFSVHLKNQALQKGDAAGRPVRDGQSTSSGQEEALVNVQSGEYIPIPFVALMAAGYLIGAAAGRTILMNMEVVLCIFFIVLQILYNNMRKLQQVFVLNSGKKEFPAVQLKKVGIFITTAAALLILTGMLLFYNGEYGNIFTLVKNGGMRFAQVIGKLLIFLLGIFGQKTRENGYETETESSSAAEMEMMPPSSDSPVMEALAETFGLLVFLAMAAALFYLLVTYVRNFNHSKKQGRDYIEYVKPDGIIQRVQKKENTSEKSVQGETKSIRRLYKRRILKATGGKAPDVTSTPSKLTRDNITSDETKAEQITRVYEKARYSDEDISSEEKEFFKNLS